MEVEKLAYEVKEQLHKVDMTFKSNFKDFQKVTAELQDERSKRKTAEIEKNDLFPINGMISRNYWKEISARRTPFAVGALFTV